MLKKKEIIAIITSAIVIGFILMLSSSAKLFLYFAGIFLLVVLINTLAKKLVANYMDTEIEIGFWEIRQFWYKKHYHLKRLFPIGIVLPVVLTVLSVGWVNWMACLTFEVKGKVARAARKARHGLYIFSDISEAQIGAIAATGIGINLVFAIIGYLLGYYDFAKINLGFVFYNMLPISNLDGNKIFFGNLVLWNFLAIITLIGVTLALIVV